MSVFYVKIEGAGERRELVSTPIKMIGAREEAPEQRILVYPLGHINLLQEIQDTNGKARPFRRLSLKRLVGQKKDCP